MSVLTLEEEKELMMNIKTIAILGYPLIFLQFHTEGGGDDPLPTNSMGGRFAWMELGEMVLDLTSGFIIVDCTRS
jgi:hypothetical protein